METFFDQFTEEQIKRQYKANLESLILMLKTSEKTGEKVNGYTTIELSRLVEHYTELAKY